MIPDCTEAAPKRSLRLRTAYFEILNSQSFVNKWSTIACMIDEGLYDVFLLSETWNMTSQDMVLGRYALPG